MDVFSTITGTIDLANKIVSYIQAVKDAKKDRLELLSGVSALGALLEILRSRFDSTNADDNSDGVSGLLKAGIKGPLHQCYKDLESVAKELERIASHTNTGKSFSLLEKMKDLAWPFRQEDIRMMLVKIERLKSLTLLGLQTSMMEFIERTRDELKNLGLNVEGIKDAILAIEGAQKVHVKETQSLRASLCDLVAKFRDSASSIARIEDEIGTIGKNQQDLQADLTIIKESVHNQELQEWLSPLDFSEKHNMVFEKCTRNTGEWFLKHPKFLAWRRGDPGYKTLWCPGHAGVGKSVMASLVINELGKEIPENTALVFIYFEYRTKYTVSQLAGVILKQLVRQRAIQSSPESLWKHEVGKHPTSEELFDMLELEVGAHGHILVVIDALDEADIEVWTPLLKYLQALPKISLLATSRDTGEIKLGLWPYQRLDITVDEGDMRKYIEDRLKSSAKLRRLLEKHTGVHEEIVAGIIKKADGMFLLAQLHMNSLETKSRVTDLRRALDELPNTLDATYGEILLRISNDDKALAYRIISWLVHAAQPMTVRDLQYALAVEDGMTALDLDDLHDEASLTSICVGLVVLREDTAPKDVTDPCANDKVVGLVHYTAQEYFLHSPNVSAQFADSPHFAITCLQYLAFDIFKTDGPPNKDTQKQLTKTPFAKYAMWSWGVHAYAHCDDKTVRRLAMELLHDSRRVVTVGSLPCRAKNLSAIHLCAHFGLKDYLESLLDGGCYINSRDSKGDTVVSYAARHGHGEIMQLLLARGGVDVNPIGWKGVTPLVQAIMGGHEGIVRLLLTLRNDLNLNPRDGLGGTPIIHAAWKGHGGIVELLLAQSGVDINSRGRNGPTPLVAAAYRGHKGIVQLLLARNGLDVNLRDSFGDTPIIGAVRKGHGSIVELLLTQDGVDINSRGRNGSTPLSAAAYRGHERIVQLLLARSDLDLNPRDNFGDTPAIYAAREGHRSIVELLLAQNDVDINSQGRNGSTPLLAAVHQGHEEIVQLLLARRDLDFNPRDSSGDTPITYAVRDGHGGIVKLLLAHGGVDINSQGRNGSTPLLAAACRGYEGIMQLLLARSDLDLNPRDSSGGTPIVHAAWKGHGGIMKLLLAQDNVDVNSQGRNGSTPLLAAAYRGHKEIVQLLLARNDLDLNPRDNFGDTPINNAARKGHSGIVELLLAQGGVDINLRGRNGSTPLSNAIRQGHEATIKLLLARADLDISWRDDQGNTYLAIAVHHNNEKVTKRLLAKGSMDVNSGNSGSQQPLALATYGPAKLSDQGGIGVNQVSSDGETALAYAMRHECAIGLLRTASSCTGVGLSGMPIGK